MDELEVVLNVLFRSGGKVTLVTPKAAAQELIKEWTNRVRQKTPFGAEAEVLHVGDMPEGLEMAFRVEDVSAVWFYEYDEPDDELEEDDDED